jgi:hypothetical protein
MMPEKHSTRKTDFSDKDVFSYGDGQKKEIPLAFIGAVAPR